MVVAEVVMVPSVVIRTTRWVEVTSVGGPRVVLRMVRGAVQGVVMVVGRRVRVVVSKVVATTAGQLAVSVFSV